MIYLYLKTHNLTGLKYLGKTVQDPYTYEGSGKHWSRHLKKHGNDVTTEILFRSEDKEEFKEVALDYSYKWNIVESKEFANLTPEEGQGGNTNEGKKHSEEHKRKISDAMKGNKHSEETKRKMSETRKGEKNSFYGKTHSEETKRKQSDVKKGKYMGEKNPRYIDINNDELIKHGIMLYKQNNNTITTSLWRKYAKSHGLPQFLGNRFRFGSWSNFKNIVMKGNQ